MFLVQHRFHFISVFSFLCIKKTQTLLAYKQHIVFKNCSEYALKIPIAGMPDHCLGFRLVCTSLQMLGTIANTSLLMFKGPGAVWFLAVQVPCLSSIITPVAELLMLLLVGNKCV